MNRGIPPSLDRQEQVTTLVVGSIILIAMFIGALYVVVVRSAETGAVAPLRDLSEPTRLDAYLAEEERASAYAVVREHIHHMPREEGVIAVFCRDSSHRWIGDVIEFRGDVDYEMVTGEMTRHRYLARLTGSKQDGWEVVSVEVTDLSAEEAE